MGRAIENRGALTLERVTILGNDAQGAPGAMGRAGEDGDEHVIVSLGGPHEGEEGGDGYSGGTGQHTGAILNYGVIEVSDSWLTSIATGAVSNLGYGDNTVSGGTGGMGGVGGTGFDGSHALVTHNVGTTVYEGAYSGRGGTGGLGGQGGSSTEGIANFEQAMFHTYVVGQSGSSTAVAGVGGSVVGSGESPVCATDFIGGVLPRSTIEFAAGSDSDSSFSFEQAAGNYGEGIESLQIELFDLQDEEGGASAVLETSTIHLDVEVNLVRETTDGTDLARWQERTITYSETGQIETLDFVMDDTDTIAFIYLDGKISQKIYTDVNADTDYFQKTENYRADSTLLETLFGWDM